MIAGHIEHNHGRLYYETDGTGEPLVFIHGFSLDHRMWREQLSAFRDYQVLTYDLRGHGRSDVPSGSYSHHDDLAALLEELEIQPVHLVGLSLGGEVALDFAVEYAGHARSLTLLSTSLSGFSGNVDWNVHPEAGLPYAKLNWLNHEVFASARKVPAVRSVLEQMIYDYSGWHWLNDDPRERPEPPAADRVRELTIPILTAVGEDDLPYYHDIANAIAGATSSAEKTVIQGAGHLLNLEKPELINALIRQQTVAR
ncbi:MAG: Non-heme bromoperoxidase BPO-A2 [candidate division WS6 bacterium OLB20]|uniref:Non-heme bromoperoxidase BPO-A2 n=1 Tax=candidate division WS6 bacterium OLB20 TaxID=1617426 RepID=A0A136LYH2_9BACT|nr:MAG: Non-heme bromoperoxidase BPO-A2 [candidate division WS6 bacterium OLB20]